MEAQFSSTKSENFQLRLRLHSCVFYRSASLSVSAALVESTLTFAFSQPPTVTCRPLSALGRSVAICFTVCMCFRSKFLRFENEKRTSLCWLNTLSIATRGKLVRTSRMSRRERFSYFSPIPGLETSESYKTSSSVRSYFAKQRFSRSTKAGYRSHLRQPNRKVSCLEDSRRKSRT